MRPLAVPDADGNWTLDELRGVPSVRLFVARAAAVCPGFELTPDNARTMSELCASLDGLPLAIELAAAQADVLRPPELLQLVREAGLDGLRSGRSDAPARHQTFRDALAWSYVLLDPAEQRLFRRLGVFAGPFTPAAAGLPSTWQPRWRNMRMQLISTRFRGPRRLARARGARLLASLAACAALATALLATVSSPAQAATCIRRVSVTFVVYQFMPLPTQ